MTLYNHAFCLGFSVISKTEDGSDVTHEMFREAVEARLFELESSWIRGAEDLVEACGCPWDTFAIE